MAQTNPPRLLIKAHPEVGMQLAARPFQLEGSTFRVRILCPNEDRELGLGEAAAARWFLAEANPAAATPGELWELAHRAVAAHEVYMEPDLAQSWLYQNPTRLSAGLGAAPGETCAYNPQAAWFPQGPGFAWHLGEGFSQLKQARDAVAASGPAPVRIGILDVGFDFAHKAKPENLRLDLQRNFVDDGQPSGDASDPYTRGLMRNPGHGTGTLGILAGGRLSGMLEPDQNTADYLGGAPLAEIVPIRIATSVILLQTSAFVEALDYLLAPNGDASLRADVVSMSMGGVASRAWADVVNRAYEAGITLVTAAGNNYLLSPQSIVFPARFQRVIAACGIMANRHPYIRQEVARDKMAGNYGPDSKMGTALAAFTPNMPWAEVNCPGVVDMDGEGTSSATPQIAAAAALWLQKNKGALPPGAAWRTVEAVRRALFASAGKGEPDSRKYYGQGVLQARAALDVAPANDLTMTPADSAWFPFLQVITGLGMAAPVSEEMLAVEATQLFHSDARLEEIITDPGAEADRKKLAPFFEAVIEGKDASPTLKGYLKAAYPKLFAAPAPGATEKPPAPPWVGREIPTPRPKYRALRGYAFDPGLSTQLETAALNQAVFKIPWEESLTPGPSGEYVEVIDHDPASGCFYAPVDLNDKELLATDGLAPTEGNPKFHQQMVYAVSMRTICNFEQALGRRALWSPRMQGADDGTYVRKLRIYPHALREENAYYNPEKKALLFGYFTAGSDDPGRQYPGEMVFACLSHDIVAHETTHALLDGQHRRFSQPSNPDQLAFHEAFADIVALFQHFSMPEVLERQIAKTRGDLRAENLLGELAMQFGMATGVHGALRSAIGTVNPETGKWERLKPDPADYQRLTEPHARGALLVAAVFDAFLSMYQTRSADLMRLASGGTGVLAEGAIHPDLAGRLSREAAKAAQHVLTICIRALDYCPPVDINFGDYLQALITADFDLEPVDALGYRVAFVEAFRRRGLYPQGLRTLSVDSLLWRAPEDDRGDRLLHEILTRLRGFADRMRYVDSREEIFKRERQWRGSIHEDLRKLFASCSAEDRGRLERELGLQLATGGEKFEVHSLRLSEKAGSDGTLHPQILLSLVQELNKDECAFTGGCTVIADQKTASVKYFVTKNVASLSRLASQREFLQKQGQSLASLYFGESPFCGPGERFAMMHAAGREDANA